MVPNRGELLKKSGAAGAAVAGSWRAVTVLKAAVAAHAAWLAASACAFPFANGAPMGLGARGPVKVALEVFSGSSGHAYLGPYLKNSLQAQIDDLNAHGGLLGSEVQLATADDQYDLTRTPRS